jgi:uncharacterized membrane protein
VDDPHAGSTDDDVTPPDPPDPPDVPDVPEPTDAPDHGEATDRTDMPMCSDGRRAAWATGIGVVTSVVVLSIYHAVTGDGSTPAARTVGILLGWDLFAILYVILTNRTFGGLDVDEFRARMAARTALRSPFWRRVDPRGDGPTYAVESAIVAFAVVLVLPHIDSIRIDDLLLVPITLSILLSCWALAIMSYAVHYAEKDLAEPSLEFPGTRTGAFADYVYFSIAVSTTFGATDVNITTPSMRKVVNLHTILTFICNPDLHLQLGDRRAPRRAAPALTTDARPARAGRGSISETVGRGRRLQP